MKTVTKFALGLAVAASLSSSAYAGGFLTDIGRATGVITKEQAETLDGLHDRFKQANPSYGQWEEETTNRTRENLGLQPHCTPVYDRYGNEKGCM